MRKIKWEPWIGFDKEAASDEMTYDENNRLVPIMVRTPLGTFSPYEQLCPMNMFDCWICCTNFDLTKDDEIALDAVDGIEALKIMSRYRFFIGIGKFFSLTDVRPQIEAALLVNNKNYEEIIAELSKYKKWTIVFMKDGSHEIIVGDDKSDEDYQSIVSEFDGSENVEKLIQSE